MIDTQRWLPILCAQLTKRIEAWCGKSLWSKTLQQQPRNVAMLFKRSFGDLVWLSFPKFGGATRIPAEDWRWKKDKSRTKHENRITWLLGTLETSTLEFWTFCALIFRRVVTFAIRVWYGRDLGIDLALIPAYFAIESSKDNPNSSWHGHQIGSLIVVDHFRVLHETCRRGGMAWIVCRRVFSISRCRSKQLQMESPAIVCLESI